MSNHLLKVPVLCCFLVGLFMGFTERPAFAAAEETNMSAILRDMENKDAKIRENAIINFYSIDLNKQPNNKRDEALTGLKRLLKDPEKAVRYEAASVIASINSSCTEAVPVLIEALEEKNKSEGRYIQELGRFGPAAASAVPVIIEAMKRRPGDHSWETLCALILENIGTPEALEAVKPYKQKWAMQIKLVNPIRTLRDSIFGSALMTFGLLGLFWWSRMRRKKGDNIVCWPLLIPVPFWGLFVYHAFWLRANTGPIITVWEAEFHFSVAIFIITLAGIIPWLISVLLWRKKGVMPSAPAS
ncbi:MAG: hypothetical protein KKH28_05665 [Elusimicrobia bacterium]|nr:hypothetical protein [Elusimicrobiota bacterium]